MLEVFEYHSVDHVVGDVDGVHGGRGVGHGWKMDGWVEDWMRNLFCMLAFYMDVPTTPELRLCSERAGISGVVFWTRISVCTCLQYLRTVQRPQKGELGFGLHAESRKLVL